MRTEDGNAIANYAGDSLMAWQAEITYAGAFIEATEAVQTALATHGMMRGQFNVVIANLSTSVIEASIETLQENYHQLTHSI